jgi:hypothetical protein
MFEKAFRLGLLFIVVFAFVAACGNPLNGPTPSASPSPSAPLTIAQAAKNCIANLPEFAIDLPKSLSDTTSSANAQAKRLSMTKSITPFTDVLTSTELVRSSSWDKLMSNLIITGYFDDVISLLRKATVGIALENDTVYPIQADVKTIMGFFNMPESQSELLTDDSKILVKGESVDKFPSDDVQSFV